MPAPNGARSAGDRPGAAEQSRTAVRKRTRARELAVQLLYQWDQRGEEALEDLDWLIASGDQDPDVREFARGLITGVIGNVETVDAKIIEVAENWDIHRMAVVDRNVLRLAAYELIFLPDIPPKVSINEAIDLAKKFSTADSGAFVNGILDKIRQQCQEPQ